MRLVRTEVMIMTLVLMLVSRMRLVRTVMMMVVANMGYVMVWLVSTEVMLV